MIFAPRSIAQHLSIATTGTHTVAPALHISHRSFTRRVVAGRLHCPMAAYGDAMALPLVLLLLLAMVARGAAAASASAISWTPMTAPRASVRIVVPPSADAAESPPPAVAVRVHLVYTAAFSDRWLPMTGPLKAGFVPTNCAMTSLNVHNSSCIGGGGFFSRALADCRRTVAEHNETCLAMFPGDWINGNSFARGAGGILAADYSYLAGFDALAFSSTDFHATMSAA